MNVIEKKQIIEVTWEMQGLLDDGLSMVDSKGRTYWLVESNERGFIYRYDFPHEIFVTYEMQATWLSKKLIKWLGQGDRAYTFVSFLDGTWSCCFPKGTIKNFPSLWDAVYAAWVDARPKKTRRERVEEVIKTRWCFGNYQQITDEIMGAIGDDDG